MIDNVRAIEDLTVTIRRLNKDGLKISPTNIVKFSKFTKKDIEAYMTDILAIMDAYNIEI